MKLHQLGTGCTKLALLAYFLFLVTIVVLANRGELDGYFSIYKRIPYGDTLGHFVLMGIFSFLANLVLRAKRVTAFKFRVLLGSLLVFFVVFLEECSQLFFADRTFSTLDLGADVAGIWVFGRLTLLVYNRQEKQASADTAVI